MRIVKIVLAAIAMMAMAGLASAEKPRQTAAAADMAGLVGSHYYAFGQGAWVSITITSVSPLAGTMEGIAWSSNAKTWEKGKAALATGDMPGGKGTKAPKAWIQNGKLYIEMPSGSTYELSLQGNQLVGSFASAVDPKANRNPIIFTRQ